MDRQETAAAFNEWMRRYTEEPDKFRREWQTVKEFLEDKDTGREPSYGDWCAGYLQRLHEDLTAGELDRTKTGQPDDRETSQP